MFVLELARRCRFCFRKKPTGGRHRIEKVRHMDMQISRVKTMSIQYAICKWVFSCKQKHDGRWPTQAGGDMYAT